MGSVPKAHAVPLFGSALMPEHYKNLDRSPRLLGDTRFDRAIVNLERSSAKNVPPGYYPLLTRPSPIGAIP